jgi:hypothetical protein
MSECRRAAKPNVPLSNPRRDAGVAGGKWPVRVLVAATSKH